ncbi:hypothetical protein EGW08_017649 [Elysia chlorotica]|uniref:Uncharacterized protein n=1 Tax=Elysia chlorotica TaxID=188477 RepID=A0A3S0ZCJ8_ELYCH|nr:hypothetical protein EGW08_017649 [Elysia chlorotica]
MSTEEEKITQASAAPEPVKQEGVSGTGGNTNENFVVLDMAGDSEDSDKEEKGTKENKEKPVKASTSDAVPKPAVSDPNAKPTAANPRLRKKPKAPVVDVNSLRKRKWQLKVYPLHADDLQLTYTSILCKLASESLLYIPSEGRHGKAELYVATQKETAAIIGKLLRMGFHHKLLSIEVVRKDTGGKEDGDESKKECKAFLMFDKFLSKKIFDAKGEKGMLVEKIVTLNKLPKAATKDFIGALFPFATDIEIIDSENPDERKATVKCKTPVTSLLVYKSFKRLEINDVHVKLSVDESVKAISLPPMFFMPPPENKLMGPPESTESLNQSSLPRRPPPMMNSLNRRVQQIKKRAILTRRKPVRGGLIRGGRPNGPEDTMVDGPHGPRGSLLGRPMMRRLGDDGGRMGPGGLLNRPGPGMRDMPMGLGRRRMNDRMMDRRNRDRDSPERKRRREEGDSHVTKEMLQLQNQLNQAIKNQIAMLNTAQTGAGPMRSDNFPLPSGSHRASLLGHGPRQFGSGGEMGGMGGGPRSMDHQSDFGGGSWSDRGRMDRGDRNRPGDRMNRGAGPSGRTGGAMDRPARPERPLDRNKRMESGGGGPGRLEPRAGGAGGDRMDRGSRDRPERDRSSGSATGPRGSHRAGYGAGSGAGGGDSNSRSKGDAHTHRSSHTHSVSHASETARSGSRGRRASDYSSTGRSTQRNDSSYSSASHGQSGNSGRYGDFNQNEGDSSYYRRY